VCLCGWKREGSGESGRLARKDKAMEGEGRSEGWSVTVAVVVGRAFWPDRVERFCHAPRARRADAFCGRRRTALIRAVNALDFVPR